MTPWMQTVSGRAIDLVDPDPVQIFWTDIAVGLSRANRFCGHTLGTVPYNVAHHSILVAELLPPEVPPIVRVVALLHDAHEAYIGDITSPVSSVLSGVHELKHRMQMAIHTAFGIGRIYEESLYTDYVLHADKLALAIEKRDVMASEPQSWGTHMLPAPEDRPKLDPLPAWSAMHVLTLQMRHAVHAADLHPLRTLEL